jgi:hypothetical protein
MSKVIIRNNSRASDYSALSLVQKVIDGGRVSASGKSYCYVTTFTGEQESFAVYAQSNKASDTFRVEDQDS